MFRIKAIYGESHCARLQEENKKLCEHFDISKVPNGQAVKEIAMYEVVIYVKKEMSMY